MTVKELIAALSEYEDYKEIKIKGISGLYSPDSVEWYAYEDCVEIS